METLEQWGARNTRPQRIRRRNKQWGWIDVVLWATAVGAGIILLTTGTTLEPADVTYAPQCAAGMAPAVITPPGGGPTWLCVSREALAPSGDRVVIYQGGKP